MKAIVYAEFGSPDVLRLEEVARPTPKRGQILVRVRTSSVNFGDIMARSFRSVTPRGFNMPLLFWLIAKMSMGWRKPKLKILGNELAGEVAALAPALRLEVRDLVADGSEAARLGVSRVPALALRRAGEERAPVRYFGLPSGHEFGAFLRTLILLSTGSGFPGVDAAAVASIARPADLTVFVLAA
jgi:NADPH:quinone reductase-like Zn-dependent oxidoreductase